MHRSRILLWISDRAPRSRRLSGMTRELTRPRPTSPRRSLGSNQVRLRRHDLAGIGHRHELIEPRRVQGEGNLLISSPN